ncbi:MAG TPA: hypothetical protein VK502_03250 [Candidatus Saccharimonadales bacterium]|nr:hypothetical protein [Candidatus Saccharimonadales bacterium]
MPTQDFEPKREQPRPANERLKAALGAMGTAMERITDGTTPEKTADEPRLLQYEDGTIVTEFTKGEFTLRELSAAVDSDPIAADMGPVLIRATGMMPDGQLQPRFAYVGEGAFISGVEDPDNPGKLLFSRKRSTPLNRDMLAHSSAIKIGEAWESPVGNLGRIDSITIPYTHAIPEDQVQRAGSISPLAQGREKIDEFIQGLAQ